MKNTWRHYLRRLAATSVVTGSMAWSSAMCYAQDSYDDASDPAYADGWQEGDNGGTGFTPWNFDGTSVNLVYNMADSHELDDGLKTGTQTSSPFNNIGTAWTIYNYNGPSFGPSNAPQGATDIARAGRGFSALQVGQTLTVVVDNPTEQAFFRGYFIRLNGGTGGVNGNICFGGAPCTTGGTPESKLNVSMFDYFSYGEWFLTDGIDADPVRPGFQAWATSLEDTVTSAGGMEIKVEMTGADTYDLTLTPLGNEEPPQSYTRSGTLDNPGIPLDWIEFTFFNTDSDFYPSMVAMDAQATDFYIRSIEITGAAAPGLLGDFNEDDVVDAADYVVWRKAKELGFADLPNDNDGAGPVGAAEYSLWRTNFGQPGGGSGLGSGAVPEPATFVYFIAGGFAMFSFALRRSRESSTCSWGL